MELTCGLANNSWLIFLISALAMTFCCQQCQYDCVYLCVCDRVAWFCGRCWCAVKWNRLLRKFSSSKDRLFCASTTKGLFELLMMTFAGWLRGVVTCQRVVRWCIITILLFSVRPFVCRHPVNERLWRKLQNCYSNRNVSFSAAIKQP